MKRAGRDAILVACVLVLGCGGHEPASTTPVAGAAPAPEAPVATTAPEGERAPTSRERALIGRLERVVERLRGLRFLRPVHIAVQTPERVARAIVEDLDDEELVESKRLYTALGLLPDGLDLRALLFDLVAEQVVGYFDPETDRLIVRDDVMRTLADAEGGGLDEARLVLVHELVHALQAQRLGLDETHDLDRPSDAASAFRSLVEGDATLALVAHAVLSLGGSLDAVVAEPARLGALAEAGPGNEELAEAPPIVRVSLVAPYRFGLVLAATLYAGGGWPSVDRAHARPPESMEQVMHPDKYLRGEHPEALTLADPPAFVAAGLTKVADDTLGELELAVYLAQHVGRDMDLDAASGWAGDEIRLYARTDGHDAVLWLVRWDTEGAARRAESAARTVVAHARSQGRELETHRRGRSLLLLHRWPGAAQAAAVELLETVERPRSGLVETGAPG